MFELASNPIGYFGKMNSTLGSDVPLAMFKVVYVTHKASILPLRRILDNESFLMSLKSTFLAFKKSCTSYPKWGDIETLRTLREVAGN